MFIKRTVSDRAAQYPDGGCNAETYCNDKFVELETLGPVTKLEPGKMVIHEEVWDLYDSLDQPFLPASLQKRLAQL